MMTTRLRLKLLIWILTPTCKNDTHTHTHTHTEAASVINSLILRPTANIHGSKAKFCVEFRIGDGRTNWTDQSKRNKLGKKVCLTMPV